MEPARATRCGADVRLHLTDRESGRRRYQFFGATSFGRQVANFEWLMTDVESERMVEN